jgi:hypothetical protein
LYITANESGRLTKGVAPHMPLGSETMRYLYHHQLPPGRQAPYARFVVMERPHKSKTKRVRPLAAIPQSIIEQYALRDKAHKGLVLVEISKGM